ncbi:hypothetical protein [Cohnella faecalis]|uniref:hypothetical protein n=1 Tax=Cohnella faecalis TaxID=2315694 RepID=UPI0011C232CD|nr:hypothetical protein [Cohnella faecalis]
MSVYQNEPLKSSQAKLFVWNGMKQQWEEIDGSLTTIVLPEPAASYLGGTKALRFKIESKDQMNYYLPSIGVEGKVKP